ncbi:MULTISPECIES: Outer membrane protein SusF domain-containing protein [Bacteroides]|uniref:Outer membrane protein SusF domain-containing protein n=1 Tax=Bacteroides TaxID=816 RepID=UPI0025C5325B|nr:DUF5115 domain-containing protein [Bacteroides sp.]
MKKNQILAGLFLAGITLGACTDDYTDWANPQSNSPEEAAAKYEISFAAGADAVIDMDKFYSTIEEEAQKTDSVEIAALSSSNSEVASIKVNSININGVTINAAFKTGNIVKVNTLELDSVVRDAFFSRAHVERVLDVNMNLAVKLKNGEAVNISGASQAKLTPITTPEVCADGYALIGDFVEVGDYWDPEHPVIMKAVEGKEGIYQATIETKVAGSNWFKIYESYDIAGGWDAANAGQIGCRVNGDDKTENFAVWTGDVYNVETPTITGKGHFVITFDAVNYTYSITPATAYLYMAGAANGWKQIDAMASPEYDNVYKGYMYLNQEGFKFCSEENWNGTNYGADFSTAADAANIMMTEEAGFYQVVVDLNEKTYTLTPIAIGIIGPATPSGWDADTDMELAEYTEEGKGTVHYWTITTELKADELKFRANDAWDISWGGTRENLTTNNGANLKIETAGTYTINLYPLCEGKSYCTIEAVN